MRRARRKPVIQVQQGEPEEFPTGRITQTHTRAKYPFPELKKPLMFFFVPRASKQKMWVACNYWHKQFESEGRRFRVMQDREVMCKNDHTWLLSQLTDGKCPTCGEPPRHFGPKGSKVWRVQ